ncbi:putative nucleosome remodeling complex ATPase subunit (Snf2h) [Aspergillus undulatus]|uniref:putative nucleosome remodeling complex ATPase subunit (Snf2h) n=1 Tax=Aspergillus undulatus TaxID=1810928 RepID=UPI003CCD8749
MNLQYFLNDDDWGSSAPSTPHTLFETSPSSPLWSPGTVITTPGSSGICYVSQGSSPSSTVNLGPPSPAGKRQGRESTVSQNNTFSDVWTKKQLFYAHIEDIVSPLVQGKTNGSWRTNDVVHGPISPYVLLDSQPAGIRAALKPYQKEGLSWLLYLQRNGIGGILADDMSLGKTLQTLSLFQSINDNKLADSRFLIVCPLSVLSTWMSEISRWTTDFTPLAYHGTKEEREESRRYFRQNEGGHVKIVITSYETLCSDLWFFLQTTWTYVVLDEGHRIKNCKSRRSQGIYKLRAQYKLVLTGTPVQNDLTELWSILHWLYPEIFVPSTAENFEDAFSLRHGKFETDFLDHVRRFLSHVMLRRTKSSPEIGITIPPKSETILSVPLTDLQLEWYHRILTGVDKSVLLGDDHGLSSMSAPTPRSESFIDATTDEWEGQKETDVKRRCRITTNTLMELRKCSIHPYLLEDALPPHYHVGQDIVTTSAKFIILQKMVHWLVVEERKKIIIFSGFEQALNLCEDLLEMEKDHIPFKHVRLDGGTPAPWRNLAVFLFQNDERYKVFLLSIRAGGEGLNLVSSSTVIFLDDDWNPQVMRQAESRVHRIGQTRPVRIFRIHAKGTVEDQMRRRLSKKAYLADKVLGDLGRNTDHPMDLEATEDQEISLMPGRAIVANAFDAKDLANSDFDSVLRSCAVDEISVQDMSLEEKKAWLGRSERVKTNIFNGEKVETSSKHFSVYEETVLGVSKASRRIGKSRVVMIDEWQVSKDSISPPTSPKSPTFSRQTAMVKKSKLNDRVSLFSCRLTESDIF